MGFGIRMNFLFPCLCVVLVLLAHDGFSTVFATVKSCEFPAIFNFGDSNSDTGGLAASIHAPPFPYGETYFHNPPKRFSDGRLIIDFMAKSAGLPYLSAYLDSMGTNFSHGANFASAGSTIRLPHQIQPRGGYSPFYLNLQVSQFLLFKSRSHLIRQQGGVFKELMPKEDYFGKALYTFDIGQNDLNEGLFGNKSIEEFNASIPDLVDGISANVASIYKMGARSFWIHNTGPIGCLPYVLVNFPSAKKDSVGCAKPYNEVAQHYNLKLKEAVIQLRKELSVAAFTSTSTQSSTLYSLIRKSMIPLVACCGYGGKYNYSNDGSCGSTINVNGSKIFVGTCERPSDRVIWDGVHYTEAANRFISDGILTGAFSDPPVTLNLACHRTY